MPLEQEIIEMLVGKHQFSENRVAKHIRLLQQARQLFPEPDQVEVCPLTQLPFSN